MVQLMPHQEKAIDKLSNGKILWGDVGSGKSIAALGYYIEKELIGDIYVITTARKRDKLDWQREAAMFGIGPEVGATVAGCLTVDSWNNIGKYEDVEGAFFIFDEQRLVGYGAWVKSFLKIAKKNAWIMLSATPGDSWMDYLPVFIANGYYKNKTEFIREHVLYEMVNHRYPKIRGYIGVKKLQQLREEILVPMPFIRHTVRKIQHVEVPYDEELFKLVAKRRWNTFEDRPCKDFSELFRVLHRVSGTHPGRLDALRELMKKHPKILVFYQRNYSLDDLRTLADEIPIAEWNGTKKQDIPDTDRWLYLVQYAAGSEGWNCTETDTTVFYDLTYSYKHFHQAHGRIDRLDTPFTVLNYYIFQVKSWTDLSILKSLEEKRDFNERVFESQKSLKGELEIEDLTDF